MNLAPSGNIPSFLQNGTWGALKQQQNQLGSLFDTSGIENAYNQQIGMDMNMGRATAAAAAARYANTAAQSGASQLGAGFAQSQALLPVFQQANQMRSDLASKQLQARSQQATVGADIAGRIGQLQSAQKSMLADYMGNQQRLFQNQQQFNQDLDYRNRALAQNQSQFNASQSERSREFDVTSGQQGMLNRLQALQLAMRTPFPIHSWYSTDMYGNGRTPADQSAVNDIYQQGQLYGNIRNQLMGMI